VLSGHCLKGTPSESPTADKAGGLWPIAILSAIFSFLISVSEEQRCFLVPLVYPSVRGGPLDLVSKHAAHRFRLALVVHVLRARSASP
jgi:hypothetical protein